MKKITSLLLMMIFAMSSTANNQIANDENISRDQKVKADQVEVYYFHGDRRCVTCKAVGSVSQELVESKYKENPKVKFIEINIDEKGNEAIVKQFKVSGSGLYVYNGNDIINITAFAFQYAINNPDKLKNKLIQLISRNI